MDEAIVVLTNLPDMQTADALANRLVEDGLAACVNILSGIRSVYRWQGMTERADEATLLIKTMRSRYDDIQTVVTAHHPYSVPELIALPIAAGLPSYLAWIAEQTRKDLHV